MSDRITVEQLVRLRIPRHELLIDLSLDEAHELFSSLDPIFEPRLIVGLDMGDRRGDWQEAFQVPIPIQESGPSLQDDIEAMIARASTDPTADLLIQTQPIKHPSNTPEPSAEPETVAETPAPSNDQQVEPKGKGGRTHEPDDVRAARLWQQYRDRRPDATPNSIVALVRGHMPKYSTAEVRELIRSTGIDIPEPDTRAQCAANARHAREAAARVSAQEPPKAEAQKPSIEDVNAPMPLAGVCPEATVQLIHALARSARRRWPEEEKGIRLLIEDLGPLTQLRKVSDAAIALFDSMNREWLDAYTDLPPFKQRDVDSALLAGWKKVAA